MAIRRFALIYGITFLLVGILGFVPGINQPHTGDHGLRITNPGHGMLLGLFHVNLLHNIVHLAFGAWGLLAYRSMAGARTYAQGVAIIYFVLAIAGLIPGLNTMFGLVPIEGHDVWLHLLLALPAAYFGFMAPHGMSSDTSSSAPISR